MTILIAAILAPFILLTLCFAVELLVGTRSLRSVGAAKSSRPSVVIIIPAHDEALIIGDTLALLKKRAGGASILVVADNCTDSTAQIARSAGVRVIERSDPARRGKGFALDFARTALSDEPPAVILIMDADCAPEPGSVERLVTACSATGRPCQAIYLQKAAPDGSPTVQLSTFAFYIKNVVRQRALQGIAGRVNLLGTGMAFPWGLFAKADLATGNIVEDLELGLELAGQGHPALLVEDAAVWSDPAAQNSTFDQRRRWDGGYLQTAAKWGPTLVGDALRHADLRRLWAGISLFVPPVAMLVMLDIGAVIASGVVYGLTGAGLTPLLILIAVLGLAGLGLIGAWAAGGSQFISLRGLARIPLYLLWKLPLYLGLARRGAPEQWVRTDRG